MRGKLKGVNRTPVRAANGEIVEYFYAWKGGPRLAGPRAFIVGGSIRKKEGQAGKRIVIPVGKLLKARLDALAESRPSPRETILAHRAWDAVDRRGFRPSWRKACIAAGVEGVTFHDLRGTAVTRLALAGATPPEIATITGHSLRDVTDVLDAHYLNRDQRLAESAIRKLGSG